MNVNPTVKQRDRVIHVSLPLEGPSEFELTEEYLESRTFQLLLKRVFDISVSSFLILLFSPILILVTLIIKLTSKGPVLYSNDRVGLGGTHFRCHKFRSMVTDQATKAEDHKIALEGQEKGILHKSKTDSRITWIGKIIRKTSIDEIATAFQCTQR